MGIVGFVIRASRGLVDKRLEAHSVGCEISWFAPLCDDDYEFLGVPDPALTSSWEHCRGVALRAEEAGFDNLLLPSNYSTGIDSVAFAAGVAPLLRRLQLLAAVRMGEMWPPQLARQLATIDEMLGGRLTRRLGELVLDP